MAPLELDLLGEPTALQPPFLLPSSSLLPFLPPPFLLPSSPPPSLIPLCDAVGREVRHQSWCIFICSGIQTVYHGGAGTVIREEGLRASSQPSSSPALRHHPPPPPPIRWRAAREANVMKVVETDETESDVWPYVTDGDKLTPSID